jgi:SAM-dependent methyltransferase
MKTLPGFSNHLPPRAKELAHLLLAGAIEEGSVVIDATCGNGHDTCFLAQCVGQGGRVIAFDIQTAAIDSTRQLLGEKGLSDRVELIATSHAKLGDQAEPGTVSVVMFNLGYLPGADKSVITVASETIAALDAATVALKPGGCLSVICYPGHKGGDDEASAVETWMEQRAGEGWKLARYGTPGTFRPAPFLLLAVKPH